MPARTILLAACALFFAALVPTCDQQPPPYGAVEEDVSSRIWTIVSGHIGDAVIQHLDREIAAEGGDDGDKVHDAPHCHAAGRGAGGSVWRALTVQSHGRWHGTTRRIGMRRVVAPGELGSWGGVGSGGLRGSA
jgi:hypothetical protein